MVFLGFFPIRILAIFTSLEGLSTRFDSHDFTLMEISSEKEFLCQTHAHDHLSINRHVSRGTGLFWAEGKRSCLPLLPKINTENTKEFYYTCHTWWSKSKMKLKSPP